MAGQISFAESGFICFNQGRSGSHVRLPFFISSQMANWQKTAVFSAFF